MTSEGCYAAHAVRPGGCAGCCALSRPSVRQRECGQANPRPHSRLWCASLQRGVKRQWCIAAWGAAFARCSQPVRPGCMFHGARKRRRARTSLPGPCCPSRGPHSTVMSLNLESWPRSSGLYLRQVYLLPGLFIRGMRDLAVLFIDWY